MVWELFGRRMKICFSLSAPDLVWTLMMQERTYFECACSGCPLRLECATRRVSENCLDWKVRRLQNVIHNTASCKDKFKAHMQGAKNNSGYQRFSRNVFARARLSPCCMLIQAKMELIRHHRVHRLQKSMLKHQRRFDHHHSSHKQSIDNVRGSFWHHWLAGSSVQ